MNEYTTSTWWTNIPNPAPTGWMGDQVPSTLAPWHSSNAGLPSVTTEVKSILNWTHPFSTSLESFLGPPPSYTACARICIHPDQHELFPSTTCECPWPGSCLGVKSVMSSAYRFLTSALSNLNFSSVLLRENTHLHRRGGSPPGWWEQGENPVNTIVINYRRQCQ